MSWVDEAIATFGQALGMDGLALDPDGGLELALESGETLRLLSLPQAEVLVACARPLGHPAGAALRRALQLADFRQNPPWPMQAALEGNALVLQMRIPERRFTADELDGAIGYMLPLQQAMPQETSGRPGGLPTLPLGWR